MPMSKINTHWYLHRSDVRIQRRKHRWQGWQASGKQTQGRVRGLELEISVWKDEKTGQRAGERHGEQTWCKLGVTICVAHFLTD
jgi:hypothetical protein